MKRGTYIAIQIAAVLAAAALIVLAFTACGTAPKPIDPCQINPTKTNTAGQWVEHDDEPLDDDPCDSDDLYEDLRIHGVTPSPRKPKPVVSPNKPATSAKTSGSNKPYK